MRACVFTYTLSWSALTSPSRTDASNVLDHAPASSVTDTAPSSTNCFPASQPSHSAGVRSSPRSIVKLVSDTKRGSKYTAVSLGALALTKRFAAMPIDSTPSVHSECQLVTSSLLFAFACQK